MAKLIFGCGYLGLRVARLWREAGEPVFAVTRSTARAEALAAEGLAPLVADLAEDRRLPLPPSIRTVLFAVGYDRAAGHSMHEIYVGGLQRTLASLPPTVERFVYISSTGVFGQAAGEEVDEDSPCRPVREGGRACLAAEELLLSSPFGNRALVLRLAGIYGPGRLPRGRELAAGLPIDAPADGWLNLIQVDDAARIVVLAADRAAPPRTYVVSDGHPVERREYYLELARLLQAPPPRFLTPSPDSPAALRAGSDKRVSPRRLFADLAPRLAYPSYREGLANAVFDGDAGAG